MNAKLAEEHGGRLSYPSKMDVPAWGIPATRCKVGSVLAQKEGTTCEGCYARTGFFKMPTVQAMLEENYRKLWQPLWVPAMVALIRWHCTDRFRWMMSGDVQNENHLRNIFQVCRATRRLLHWMPSREERIVKALRKEIPDNLTIRLSATLVDGKAPKWPWTSTVVTEATDDTCPSSLFGGNCGEHDCTACWDRDRKNVPYLQH